MLKITKSTIAAATAAICTAAAAPKVFGQDLAADPYTLCAFRPQTSSCDALYHRASSDQPPAASAVKDAFEGYGRYLRDATGTLTDKDRQYLSANAIRLPDLTSEDQAGLHAVLSDPTLMKNVDARLMAVNNFLGHAVQAELYCEFHSCNDGKQVLAAEASTTQAR